MHFWDSSDFLDNLVQFCSAIIAVYALLEFISDEREYRRKPGMEVPGVWKRYGKLVIAILGFTVWLVSWRSSVISKREDQQLRTEIAKTSQSLSEANRKIESTERNAQLALKEANKAANMGDDVQRIHEVTKKLEQAEEALRPRSLSSSQINALVKALASFKGTRIGIKYRANDTESLNLASQFREVFAKAGWDITRVAMTFYYAPVYGIELCVKTEVPPEAATAILAQCRKQGIEIKQVLQTGQSEQILVRIGQKP